MLPLLLLLVAATPSKAAPCRSAPVAGTWFRPSSQGAPKETYKHPELWPNHRPFVTTVPGGLLVLTPEGGGRYDLCTDRWQRVAPLLTGHTDYGLPQPTITERNLYFVGPTTLSEPFGIFARFDLGQNRWRPFPRKGAPRPRLQHLQSAVGGKLVLYLGQGGTGHSEPRFTDGAVFDPARGEWSPIIEHEHSIGFESLTPVGDSLVFWPYGHRYDLRTRAWGRIPTAGRVMPYQPVVRSTRDRILTLGGMWTEYTGAEWLLGAEAWTPFSAYKPAKPKQHLSFVVSGEPVLIPALPNQQRIPAAGGTWLMPGQLCSDWTYEFVWLNRPEKRWEVTTRRYGDEGRCDAPMLITDDALFLIHWPYRDRGGEVRDGEVLSLDPRTGRWRRAVMPAEGAPPSPAELRWDGKAFWQWGTWQSSSYAAPDQCANTPAGMGCDPVVETRLTHHDEAWRFEPIWSDG